VKPADLAGFSYLYVQAGLSEYCIGIRPKEGFIHSY